MSVLKPRNRLVYFRLSEDEFQKFTNLCQTEGARSISDMARTALQRVLQDGAATPESMVSKRLEMMDRIIAELNQKLGELAQLIAEKKNVNANAALVESGSNGAGLPGGPH